MATDGTEDAGAVGSRSSAHAGEGTARAVDIVRAVDIASVISVVSPGIVSPVRGVLRGRLVGPVLIVAGLRTGDPPTDPSTLTRRPARGALDGMRG
ncbi:hypothetical protein K6I33_004710 [Streptomyces sp. UNOB3_S3]|nr:hypothetical protein [Streptomyces sp. UNOB3_S3]